ncbi:RNA-directed DNA polymerase, eukaryota [Artemisia annua]|uniref:RNA-directed DNA polymerase, eukaryota n=1 Tax=Artemisia annua TaxID=35608 RepID=A0A2U1KF64_ARTAN|nr:RNA-directed DNA polymerase, eukaryota [Artemisia annua]
MGADRVKEAKVQTLRSDFEVIRMKNDESVDDFAMRLNTIVTGNDFLRLELERDIKGTFKRVKELHENGYKNIELVRGDPYARSTETETNRVINGSVEDLWNKCNEFGTVVDAYIARKLSKIGRRFAFVRFIRIQDSTPLINRLCDVWIGNHHLFASIARFQRKPDTSNGAKSNNVSQNTTSHIGKQPTLENKVPFASLFKKNVPLKQSDPMPEVSLDKNDMISITDAGTIVLGKVKDLSLIENIYSVCHKEGFSNVDINYIGGSWVWIEFNNRNACIRFKKHEGLASYFHSLAPVSKHFVVDDRVVWIDIEGLPLCAWSASAFTKIAASWGEVMFINDDEDSALSKGRVCLKLSMGKKVDENMLVTVEGLKYKIRIKEIGAWRPSIIKLSDSDTSESDSEDDGGTHVSSSNEEQNEDEEKIYDKKDLLGVQSQELPKSHMEEKNDAIMDDKANDVSVEWSNSDGLNMQQGEEQKRDTNDCMEQTRESTPSRPLGFEDTPINTFGNLNEEVKSIPRTSYSASSNVNVAQSCDSLGGDIFKRRRIANICSRHNVNFLGIQESRVTSIDLFMLKSLWGNFTFDFAVSSARGMSGGIISLWDPAAFVKSKVTSFDHMLIVQGQWVFLKFNYFIVNIYAPQDTLKKRDLWHALSMFMYNNEGNYIIFGDFNAVREESERWGCNFIQREADDFNTFITSNHLVDVPMGVSLSRY